MGRGSQGTVEEEQRWSGGGALEGGGSLHQSGQMGKGDSGGVKVEGPWEVKQNDVEIICVSKQNHIYAKSLEDRLKNMGLEVDVLFPNQDILICKVLGNIAYRGVMYAIEITPQNEEQHTLTLNILQGQQQEHRNMPVDDAFTLISKNFSKVISEQDSETAVAGGKSLLQDAKKPNSFATQSYQVGENFIKSNNQPKLHPLSRLVSYTDSETSTPSGSQDIPQLDGESGEGEICETNNPNGGGEAEGPNGGGEVEGPNGGGEAEGLDVVRFNILVLWNERQASKGANEVSEATVRMLTIYTRECPLVESLCLFADACSSQVFKL